MGKFTKVKLISVDGRTFTVTLEHAEKILKSKNNKQTNIKLASDTFELTVNFLFAHLDNQYLQNHLNKV